MFCSSIIELISIFKKYDLTNQWIWIYEQKRDSSPIRGQEKNAENDVKCPLRLVESSNYWTNPSHAVANLSNYIYTHIHIHIHNYTILYIYKNTYHDMDIFHGGHVWNQQLLPQGDYSALELRKAGFSAKELKQGLRKGENVGK